MEKSQLKALLQIGSILGSSLVISTMFPAFPFLTACLILGLVGSSLYRNEGPIRKSIEGYEKFCIAGAISLMGLHLSIDTFRDLGLTKTASVIVAAGLVLLVSIIISKRLKGISPMVILIGIGTSICGSAAILATSSFLAKEKKHITLSITAVNLVGIIGLAVLPVLIKLFELDSENAGVLIGGSLQSVAHVVASSFMLGDEIGHIATSLKLERVALLVPLVILLNSNSNSEQKSYWSLLPTYLYIHLGFLALTNLVELPTVVLVTSKSAYRFLLAVAMACIGLNTRFQNIFREGISAFFLSTSLFTLMIAILLTSISLLG